MSESTGATRPGRVRRRGTDPGPAPVPARRLRAAGGGGRASHGVAAYPLGQFFRRTSRYALTAKSAALAVVILGGRHAAGALGWEGRLHLSSVAPLLTGAFFVTGVLLGGVMTDYKEAEKIPVEIVAAFSTLEDIFRAAAVRAPGAHDAAAMHAALLRALDATVTWLTRRSARCGNALADAFDCVADACTTPETTVAFVQIKEARRSVLRATAISRTCFLPAAMAFLEALHGLLIALLQCVKLDGPLELFAISFVVPFVFIFMMLLIRDVDDPFDFDGDGEAGAAEVDIQELLEYTDRLRAKCARMATVGTSPADVCGRAAASEYKGAAAGGLMSTIHEL